MDHAFFHRVRLNSDATHASITHVMVGVHVMMDRERLRIHSGGIISGGQGVVNQNEYEPLTDF